MHPLGILDSHNQKETIVILRDSIFKEINLFDEFKTQIKREPTSNETVKFVVEKGARLIAPTTKQSAILVDDRWTVNNKLTLVNEGFILGKGGAGGFGAFMYVTNFKMSRHIIPTGKQPVVVKAENGETGGSAITCKRKLTVLNNGVIASGGGGGGGSGAWLAGFGVIGNSTRNSPVTSMYNGLKVDSTYGGNTGSGGAPFADYKPNACTIDWLIYKNTNQTYKQILQDLITYRVPGPNDASSLFDGIKRFDGSWNNKYFVDNLRNMYNRHYAYADFNSMFHVLPSYGNINSLMMVNVDFKTAGRRIPFTVNESNGNKSLRYSGTNNTVDIIGSLGATDNTEFYLSSGYDYGGGFLGSEMPKYLPYRTRDAGYFNASYFVGGKSMITNYTGSLMSTKDPTSATMSNAGETGYVGIKRLVIGEIFRFTFTDGFLNPFWHNENGRLTRKNKEEEYASGGTGGKWGVNGNDGTLNKAYCSKNSARGYPRSETMLTAYFDIPIDHNMEWHKAPPGKGGVAGKIYTGNVVIDSKSRGYLAGYLPSGEYKPNNIPDWLVNRAENWNKQGDLLTK